MKYFIPILFLFHSCAEPGVLGGGKKDEKPPILLNTNLVSTNFHSKQITLEFDEYVALNAADQNIKLLPYNGALKIDVSHKKVIIKIDSALAKNSTYNLIIENGIQDINANNSFNYNYIFSTGDNIDTSYIQVEIPDFKQYKNLKLAFNNYVTKDSFRSFDSYYILEVKKERIIFKGIKPGKYNLWLFTDLNNDKKPDYYEPMNFILNANSDTNYVLNPVTWGKPFIISKKIMDSKFSKVYYNHSVHYYKHFFLPSLIVYAHTDSALVSNNYPFDSIKIIDTVKFIDITSELKSIIRSSLKIIKRKNDILITYLKPHIYSNNPINDSMNGVKIKTETLIFKTKPEHLVFKRTASLITDTIFLEDIPEQNYNQLAYLKLDFPSATELFDLFIYKENKPFINMYDTNTFEDFLLPGDYKIVITEKSSLHEFDPFQFKTTPKILFEKVIHLKASWEEILQIKFK